MVDIPSGILHISPALLLVGLYLITTIIFIQQDLVVLDRRVFPLLTFFRKFEFEDLILILRHKVRKRKITLRKTVRHSALRIKRNNPMV